mmetsp:Transcript_5485/g.5440  ORF Transcript_5485/g.5440 Transcript_5485/m.5440 type:complete len:211 (+) Transcript_5485:18-650(+)
MKFLSLFVLYFSISAVYAVLGVDISDYISSDAFHCMAQNGYSFAVARGYCSFGGVDPNGVDNIENSIDGGMNVTDVYLFPCVPCGNPAGQVDALVDYIAGTGYGMVWLDIETYSWSSNLASNQQFILALANELVNQGQSVGVYTNYYNWQSIVGLGWTGVSQYPLWYAHYDDWPSFGDFTPFGGWNEPTIKQFNGDVTVCGVNVDQNYRP